MEQHDLPLTGGVRRTDPDTSHAAAAAVNVNKLERMLLECLNDYSQIGLTMSEIAKAVRMPRDSLSPRAKRLTDIGFIVDSGERRVPSHFGLEEQRANTLANSECGLPKPPRAAKQIVWKITAIGAEFLRVHQRGEPNVRG